MKCMFHNRYIQTYNKYSYGSSYKIVIIVIIKIQY